MFCHLRAFENVKELELYSVETGAEAGQPGDGFQHIFPGLPGQPEDDVNNDSDFALFEAFVGIFEDRECVAPVESMSGAFMDGLETQLYPDRLYTVQVGEHVEDLIRQTVRPGADGDCGNLRKGGCFEEEIPKARRIAIGICEGLEVGDVSALIFRASAKSPEPPSEQKEQPPYPSVPSRFGQVQPAERESLYTFVPKVSFR